MGSTAVDLAARAGQTILAYGPAADNPLPIVRVVAFVDGSEFSELSVTEGVRWAAALDVSLFLAQVVPPTLPAQMSAFESGYVHNLAERVQDLNVRLEWEVLHSTTPAQSILNAHGSDPATMLVLVTHARVGLQRVLHGSVSTQVVKEAWGPVVLVRPTIDGSSSNAVM